MFRFEFDGAFLSTTWRPEQALTPGAGRAWRKSTSDLATGDLVIWERSPYRVTETRERDHTDWPEKYLEKWTEHHCPDPATWYHRPMTLTLRPEPEPAAEPTHLLALRSAFLSAKRVRDAYLGYATQQFRKLLSHGRFGSDIPDRRTSKHARHLKRLVDQGFELYTTGRLTIRLLNPQTYFDFGEQVAADPQAAVPFMAAAEEAFNRAVTPLPDEPSRGAVECWLRHVRAEHYIAAKEAA